MTFFLLCNKIIYEMFHRDALEMYCGLEVQNTFIIYHKHIKNNSSTKNTAAYHTTQQETHQKTNQQKIGNTTATNKKTATRTTAKLFQKCNSKNSQNKQTNQ